MSTDNSIVRTYLEAAHRSLLTRFDETAAAGTHGGDLGENREQLIVDFINQNQPRRLHSCRGGQVIGLDAAPSKQIDVLVTHDSTIEFRAHGKSYRIVEAILAGIAVKSNLTGDALIEDIGNLASIPAPSHRVLMLSHEDHEGLFQIYARSFPARMVIGWKGATQQTLEAVLNSTLSTGYPVPIERLPKVVTVLKQGLSFQLMNRNELLQGKVKRDDVHWRLVRDQEGPAWPLAWLLNQLGAGSGWAAQFSVDLQQYW